MPLSLVQNDTQSEIRLEGIANIAIASELKNVLLEELSAGRPLLVSLSSATEVDVCVFQLLLVADRAWKQAGLSFALCGPLQQQAHSRLADAGLCGLNVFEPEGIMSEV